LIKVFIEEEPPPVSFLDTKKQGREAGIIHRIRRRNSTWKLIFSNQFPYVLLYQKNAFFFVILVMTKRIYTNMRFCYYSRQKH